MKRSKGIWLQDEHYWYKVIENCTEERAQVWNEGIGKLSGMTMVRDGNSGTFLLRVSNHLGKAMWQTTKLGMIAGAVAVYTAIDDIKSKICS